MQRRILGEEYPTLRPDGDPDIERYFELRRMGKQAEALTLYAGRLMRKYPDDAKRERLFRAYRLRDPRFEEILADSLADLAERMLARATSVIAFLTKDIDSVNVRDAYSVIKLAEGLIEAISPDRRAAIAFTERYARHARAVGFCAAEMERVAELIRLYVTDTIESVQSLRREREERRAQAARARSKVSAGTGFDLSRVSFSPRELERILIPASITRVEDQVIAYCAKYWAEVSDPAFERTIFLYSRKFRTKHSDVFQAVKNGREHGWKDEEILNAVLANVVTGYYYNISGDLYLQRAWRRLKGAGGAAVASALAADAERTRAKQHEKPAVPRLAAPRHEPRSKKPKDAVHAAWMPESTAVRVRVGPPETAPRNAQPSASKPASTVQAFSPNSINDLIRRMTGKTYSVYRDIFFGSIRPSIRAVLAEAAGKKGGLLDGRQNRAEEIIYGFLSSHYDDPYQNWHASAERRETAEQGYPIASIEPIVAHWLEHGRSERGIA